MSKPPEFGGPLRFTDPKLAQQLRTRNERDLEERFIRAIQKPDAEAMKKCLEQGVNIFYCRHTQAIPFKIAWQSDSSEALKFLLENGLDPQTLSTTVREQKIKALKQSQQENIDHRTGIPVVLDSQDEDIEKKVPEIDLLAEFLLHSELKNETLFPTEIQAKKKRTALENLRWMIMYGLDPELSFIALNPGDLEIFKNEQPKSKYSLLEILDNLYNTVELGLRERGKILKEAVMTARSKWVSDNITPLAKLEKAIKEFQESEVESELGDQDPTEIMAKIVPKPLLAKYQLAKKKTGPATTPAIVPSFQAQRTRQRRRSSSARSNPNVSPSQVQRSEKTPARKKSERPAVVDRTSGKTGSGGGGIKISKAPK